MTGILCVNKPQGITSFGAVARVRRMLGRKKCGHTGTLDPMATGVLPILIGGASKFSDLIPNQDKAYRATVKLGLVTDTLDITGTVLEEREVNATRADFEAALGCFRGEIEQVPPMYSAVFHNGVRLYDLARQGIEVERQPRKITIYSLELISADEEKNEYVIDVHCSKGTYIRTLAGDIGEKLGCGAVLTTLCRTVAHGYDLSRCVNIEDIESMVDSGEIYKHIMAVETAFEEYKDVHVTQPQAVRFQNGASLSLERLTLPCEDGVLRVFTKGERKFLGLGEICKEKSELCVKKLMVYGDSK
ncbi:MAG: tRNA pseudouridine(55) synthase TruB [Clostridia bacterium]|nr:tRNA pseudouridine(55) synthase TruB [Clostridia bacterium]